MGENDYQQDKKVFVYTIPVADKSESLKKYYIWWWIIRNPELFDSADVIHAHDVYFWLFPYKLLHPSKKTYVTFHGWEGKYPIPIKNIIIRKMSELIATANLCVGEYISKWYRTIPDEITYGAVAKRKYPVVYNNQLLYLGRLDSDTGFEQCLRLYELLKPKLGWKLVIAGDGPLKNLIPHDSVWLGFTHDPEKYISVSSYVFTSGYLGILEALNYGKTVLATYSNPVKKDYLQFHPQAKNMFISSDYHLLANIIQSKKMYIEKKWIKNQTWNKLANQYLTLWQN